MHRELRDGRLHQLAHVPLPEEVVWPRRGILELERTILVILVRAQRLIQHDRIAPAVPELVLREIRRDGVDPGRELLRPVEPREMAMHPDEGLLHEILSPLPVSDGPVDEVQQPGPVPMKDHIEGAALTLDVFVHQGAIIETF